MSRSLTIFLLLLAPLVALGAEKPNVLFIIADDLSAQALGCYGNRQCKTPHIDALAAQGTKFDRAYCQFPVCGPSRAALMSGLYPQAIGVLGNGSSGRFTANLGDRPSMTQHFRQHGYHAARVSKIYHMRVPGDITAGVDGPDHAASWSERHNCQGPEWMTRGEHRHLTKEKLNRDPDKHYGLGFGGAFYVVKGESHDGAEQPDAKAAHKAIEIMMAQRHRPFFLAVGLVRPHVPLVAPAAYYDPYPEDEMALPFRISDDWSDIPAAGISKNSNGIGLGTQAGKQRAVLSAYYASVTFMDAQVGLMIAALEALDLRQRTIILFTSDHGYHLGEHDFWQKMSLHEESVRIPLIIAAPGKRPGVTRALVEQIDLYPTLAKLAGLAVPPHCQGRSAARLLVDPARPHRDEIYCLRGKAHLIRSHRHAYLAYPDGSEELYDMESDPHQFTNLASRARHSETRSQMKALLEKKLAEIRGS